MKRGKRITAIFLIVLIIVIVGGATFAYLLVFDAKPCESRECFDLALKKCKAVYFINENDQASWNYAIIGNSGEDSCKVEVRLLKIKKGSIENEKLEGKKMICEILKTGAESPEKDMSKCTGELKEEIQDMIIRRMHDYILENIGEVSEELRKL